MQIYQDITKSSQKRNRINVLDMFTLGKELLRNVYGKYNILYNVYFK